MIKSSKEAGGLHSVHCWYQYQRMQKVHGRVPGGGLYWHHYKLSDNFAMVCSDTVSGAAAAWALWTFMMIMWYNVEHVGYKWDLCLFYVCWFSVVACIYESAALDGSWEYCMLLTEKSSSNNDAARCMDSCEDFWCHHSIFLHIILLSSLLYILKHWDACPFILYNWYIYHPQIQASILMQPISVFVQYPWNPSIVPWMSCLYPLSICTPP